jgi:hypothetical protein
MKEYANSTHHQRVQEITDHHKQKPRDCVSTSPSVILQNEVLVNITPRVRETTTGSRVVIVHEQGTPTRPDVTGSTSSFTHHTRFDRFHQLQQVLKYRSDTE